MSAEAFDTDHAMTAIGGGSRWTMMVYCATNLIFNCPAGWAMLATVFVGAEVKHHCTIPDDLRPAGHVHLNQSIPMETLDNGEMQLSKCLQYVNFSSSTNQTTDCTHGWTYDDEMTTIASEWDLVCSDSFYPETTQTVLVLGVLVGALVMAILSDMYGRKLVCLGSVLGISIITFITAWVNNYYLFTALRFVTGILQQGIVLPGFVLACELFPAEQRTVAGLVIQCFWGLGMCFLATFAYFIRDWRNLLIATSIPGLLAIPLYWVIPESIPWLVAKNRFKEAKEILKKAAKFNGIELPKEFQLSEEEEALLAQKVDDGSKKDEDTPSVAVRIRGCCRKKEKDTKHEETEYTLIDVMKSSKLRMFAFIMCYLWCVSSLVYYGLSLSTGSLAGNRYMNFFLSGIVEIPAYLAAAALLHFIGRRYPICAFHFLAGIPLLVCLGIPKTTESGTSLVPLITTLSMISKCGIAACFGCVFLYAPELFPTTIRNASMGIASVGGRLGNIFAPFSSYVVKIVPWFPGLLFGVMAIIAGLLTLVLPETLHRPLPLTIEEVEQWSRTLSKEDKENYKRSRTESKARKRAMEMEPVPNDVS